MTTGTMRLKLLRPTVKMRSLVHYPASLTTLAPVVLSQANGIYTFSLDMNALETTLLPWVAGLIGLTQRVVTAPGVVAVVAADNDIIVIKKAVGAATAVNLPSAASRLIAGLPTNRIAIRIVDGKYDAATNNITILPNGTDTVMGGASYLIDSNGASITLTPLADGSGWV